MGIQAVSAEMAKDDRASGGVTNQRADATADETPVSGGSSLGCAIFRLCVFAIRQSCRLSGTTVGFVS